MQSAKCMSKSQTTQRTGGGVWCERPPTGFLQWQTVLACPLLTRLRTRSYVWRAKDLKKTHASGRQGRGSELAHVSPQSLSFGSNFPSCYLI